MQEALGVISAEIDVTILQSTKICPKQIFSTLPVTPSDICKLEAGLPCVLCARFWVENAIASLPCECLLHPVCMLKVALLPEPRCPFYSHVSGELWRAQWGYTPTSVEMLSSALGACNAGMDGAGWMKPLDVVAAQERVKDLLNFMGSQESVAKPKHALAMDRESDNQPLPKRPHLEITMTQPMDQGLPSILEEISAIRISAAEEASAASMQETYSQVVEMINEESAAMLKDA